jgi:hypothetical protein
VSPSTTNKLAPLLNAYALASEVDKKKILDTLELVFRELPPSAIGKTNRTYLLDALKKVSGQ